MKKNIIIFSALALFSTGEMYGMGDMLSFPPPLSEKDQTLLVLCHNRDPNRYGPLNIPATITDRDHNQATNFMRTIKSLNTNFQSYPSHRHAFANAIVCGHYHEKIVDLAASYNDLPLWQLLIAHQTNIKEKHNIDVATVVTDPLFGPPLWQTKSLAIVRLLAEKGGASITQPYKNESFISHICKRNYSPDILAYCLEKHPQGVNTPDKYTNTPLLSVCSFAFDPTNSGVEKSLLAALEKLDLLKKAGTNFLYRNHHGRSALDIVEDQIKEKQKDPDYWAKLITSLSTVAARLKIEMEAQRTTKIIDAKGQDCSLCLLPMNTDIHLLDCLHTFHETCILQTMHAGHIKCPICRANSMPKDKSQTNNHHN